MIWYYNNIAAFDRKRPNFCFFSNFNRWSANLIRNFHLERINLRAKHIKVVTDFMKRSKGKMLNWMIQG